MRGMLAAVGVLALVVVGGAAWVQSLGPLPLDNARQMSQSVVDRHDKLLRAVRDA